MFPQLRWGHRPLRRLAVVASAVVVAGVAAPGAASAYTQTDDGNYCDDRVAQSFSAFDDFNWYALAPGGDFEGSTLENWSLSRAQLVPDNEPFQVTGTHGTQALKIAAGGVVTSPTVCVDPSRETLRFFARSTSSTKAKLRVEALFDKKQDGSYTTVLSAATLQPSKLGVWEATPIIKNEASKYVAPGTLGNVTYRFRAESGSFIIDDFHIDPRLR